MGGITFFGTEKNKDILIAFLNDMITFKEGEPITEVTFLKTVQDPEIAAQKTSIVDVLCKDQKATFKFEVQRFLNFYKKLPEVSSNQEIFWG